MCDSDLIVERIINIVDGKGLHRPQVYAIMAGEALHNYTMTTAGVHVESHVVDDGIMTNANVRRARSSSLSCLIRAHRPTYQQEFDIQDHERRVRLRIAAHATV